MGLLRRVERALIAASLETRPGNPRIHEVAFDAALRPMVDAARARLASRLATSCVDAAVMDDLARQLTRTLGWMWGPTLFHEFSIRRARHVPTALLPLAVSSRTLYDAFVNEVRDGLVAAEYPVLARLSAVAVDLWVDASAELLERLARDARRLADVFGAEGPLVSLVPGLSDRHHGGRTVCVLTFANNVRVVYKPRSVRLERAWFDLLGWCATRGLSLLLHRLAVLECDGYGWVEFVAKCPVDHRDAAHRFYHRAGLLLCLLYVLEGSDCHFENVVAHGEHPVVVDLETLLHPRSSDLFAPHAEGAVRAANEALWDSVIRTHFLPRWVFLNAGQSFDISGLGAAEARVEDAPVAHWSDVATDGMTLRWTPYDLAASGPVFDGSVLEPHDFLCDIVAGFHEMYAVLVSNADEVPLQGMRGAHARCLIRATRVYLGLLDEAVQTPSILRDEDAFRAHLERLGKAVEPLPADHPYRLVVPLEQAALQRLDVPRWSVPTDGVSLHEGADTIPDVYAMPAHARVEAALARLGEDDARLQESIIRASLAARAAPDPSRVSGFAPSDASTAARAWCADAALAVADRIAHRLASAAIRADDGGATWIGLQFFPPAGRYQLQPLDASLYDGTAGIALFFATLTAVSGEPRHRDLAFAAFRPVRSATLLPLGAGLGIGGCIYALVHGARLLDEPRLRDDAVGLAANISPQCMADDRQLDVLGGLAGAILALLALGDVARADRCARFLMGLQTSDGAWNTMNGRYPRPLTGFAHGTAGIACALLRLHGFTRDSRVRDAAHAALDYENAVFSQARDNWPDLRDDPPRFVTHWCHGAPGIALSRLEAPSERAQLNAALRATRACPPAGADHLCCGSMGRASVLFEVGHALDDEALQQQARDWAATVASRDGGGLSELTNPGLFQGVAGIGLALLRMARPDIVPSVLRFA